MRQEKMNQAEEGEMEKIETQGQEKTNGEGGMEDSSSDAGNHGGNRGGSRSGGNSSGTTKNTYGSQMAEYLE